MPISLRSSFARFPVKSWKAEKNLKLVGILRAGIENIDLLSAKQFGIGVLNVQGRNAQAVAEFTLGLLRRSA